MLIIVEAELLGTGLGGWGHQCSIIATFEYVWNLPKSL